MMLGSDSMSSNESGDKDMQMVFHTHAMLWRRDIKNELNIINTQWVQEKDVFSQKGAKVAKCIHSGNALPSLHSPVTGLL